MADPDGPPDDPDKTTSGSPHVPSGDASLRRLGDFEILGELGRGGMGVVYEARQISLNRRVALKVLPPGLGLTQDARIRFEREAQAAARLHHTNIVSVHAIGEQDGHHFYAMELVDGGPLSRILDDLKGGRASAPWDQTMTVRPSAPKSEPAPGSSPEASSSGITTTGGRDWFDTVARLVADVADALEYAHASGVIHRDIKPGNLLLSRDGRLSIADFGLARVAQEPGMTMSGSLIGTPAYMSPEQIAAGRMKLDHRTDVYSLGAVLYEMLTLERPFPGESREEIITGILTKEPRPPKRVNARVPLDLETICLKAMEKDPDRRYASAAEMAADLRSYLQRGLIMARRAGAWRRIRKLLRRHPVAAVSSCAVVLLLAVSGLAWMASRQLAEEAARRAVADSLYEMSQGRYREGLRRVDSALAISPFLSDARLVRARLLIKLNRAREAAQEAEALLEENPDEWTAHLVLAAAARGAEGIRSGTSIDDHIRVVEAHAPKTAEAYYLRSLVADTDTKAVELLDRALDLDPGHADALLERSRRFNDLHRFQEALADCDRLLAARPRSAQARRQKSEIHSHHGDKDKALQETNRALELDPEDTDSLLARADAHETRGRTEEALADINRVIALDPASAEGYSRRSRFYDNRGRYDEARTDLEKALELNPEDVSAYSSLLWMHRRRGETNESLAVLGHLENASASWTDSRARSRAHLTLAEEYQGLGEYERSLAHADKAAALDPDNWQVFFVRAYVKRLLGDETGFREDCATIAGRPLEEFHEIQARAYQLAEVCERTDVALSELGRLITFDPSWSNVYNGRAGIYRLLGRLEESIADSTKCIELSSSVWCFSSRARTYVLMRDFGRALADVDRAIGLEPGLGWLQSLRGRVLLLLGRTSEALEAYDSEVKQFPESVESRAWGYVNLGRLEEALADIKRSIDLMPSNPMGYLSRGYLLTFKEGSCAEAVADLRKAREVVPTKSWPAWSFRVDATAQLIGLFHACPQAYDPGQALDSAKRAAVLAPVDPNVEWILGVAFYRNGRHEEARRILEKILPRDGEQVQELFFLAMVSQRLGRSREARAYYERAVTLMKDTPLDLEERRIRDEATRALGAA